MLIINPLKPFYKNTEEKIIRMGNFKDTGKEINYEDDSLIKLFEIIRKPTSREKIVEILQENDKLSLEEINEALDYLIKEKFIIKYEDYNKIINSGKFNRQSLFFSMVSDDLKEWKVNNEVNILILGIGGVGANVAVLLSRAGFSKLTLVDYDKVEESNLIRQIPYSINDIGKSKTEAIAEKIDSKEISTINKEILKESDIESEIANTSFVICTLDKPSRVIRRTINKLCVKYNKPVIFSGFAEHVAMIGPFIIPSKTACLKCIERESNNEPLNNVTITPSYGPLCLIIASIVSNEVINYFFKFKSSNLINKTMMFNILSYETNIINWQKKKDCEVCGKNDSK